MTLRIFEVSADGVAVAVPKNKDRETPAPAPTPPPAAPAGPERWTGSHEWDKLRSRLRDTEPSMEPQSRRRR